MLKKLNTPHHWQKSTDHGSQDAGNSIRSESCASRRRPPSPHELASAWTVSYPAIVLNPATISTPVSRDGYGEALDCMKQLALKQQHDHLGNSWSQWVVVRYFEYLNGVKAKWGDETLFYDIK